ncbi:MAG TPA: putative 2OG-Fe(II) oxygenase, partial [Woeseiaceae bacterium]|nr:putative 2OG-Fe(II) oxygenase [Woeseiaceae bacterium]
AHHNLGVCLRIENRPADAIPHYKAARERGLDRAELYHNLGNALADVGNAGEAVDAYRASLARNPRNRDCHRNLSSLLWQQEMTGDHLDSYRQALLQDPTAASLRLDFAMALNQQGMYEEAEKVLAQGLGHGDSSELKSLLAYTFENQGRWPEALQLHAAAVALPGASPNLFVSFARALLAAGRPDEAVIHAKHGAMQMPFNQRALAYLTLCWRMLGDERDEILNDYEHLVGVYDVPVPSGFSGAAAFNSRLNEVLDTIHTGKRPPPEQTVRGGTQTSGDLFVRREPEIASLVDGLRSCIREYIDRLPGHPEHPMLSRRSESFDFSASWSVRLQSAGFHTMHIHPLGWISSAYYVHVPPEVAGPAAKGGELKFGEPDIDIGPKGNPRRYVQPAVGRLVLFPSYMWHGTVPFDSVQPRTTVAFDVVPVVKR